METFTFLFTDIEGSTTALGTVSTRRCWPVITRWSGAALAAHGDEEIDTQGDAFFAVF